jgi:hypothetical protein
LPTLDRQLAIPLNDYATGTHNLPSTNILDNATGIYFEISRCTTATPTIWPNASTELSISLEVSLDGGATWLGLSGFGSTGGIFIKRDGSEATVSSSLTNLPAGTGRKVRGTATIVGGPLRSQGFFEARN